VVDALLVEIPVAEVSASSLDPNPSVGEGGL
jgi:pyrimidine deaminase RibD-like protein